MRVLVGVLGYVLLAGVSFFLSAYVAIMLIQGLVLPMKVYTLLTLLLSVALMDYFFQRAHKSFGE